MSDDQNSSARATLLGAAHDAVAALKRFETVMVEHEEAWIGATTALPLIAIRSRLEGTADFMAGRLPPVDRTPEVVLRAMLRAYEEALLVAHAAYMGGDRTFEAARKVDRLAADTAAVRGACAWVISGHADVDLREHRLDDYEARLDGSTPLDAPPMEV